MSEMREVTPEHLTALHDLSASFLQQAEDAKLGAALRAALATAPDHAVLEIDRCGDEDSVMLRCLAPRELYLRTDATRALAALLSPDGAA